MLTIFGIIYDTIMAVPPIVIDTNVFVAALRSRRGASHKLLALIDSGKFQVNLSVPLILEYEDAATRMLGEITLTAQHINDIIDYICHVANMRHISYLWRPRLNDLKDDMVLELAVTGRCTSSLPLTNATSATFIGSVCKQGYYGSF
jgi:putative PIN family toxin of toxin-antitoxin system